MTNAMGPPPPRNPNSADNPASSPIVEPYSSSSGAEEAATSAITMKSAMGPPPPRNPNSDTSPEINSIHESSSSSGAEAAATAATTTESAVGPPPRKLATSKSESTQSNMDVDEVQPQSGSTGVAGVAEAESNEKSTENSEFDETAKPKPSQGIVVPYKKPAWSGAPCHEFYLEVLKDGCIIERLNVNEKGAYMFGRLDLCDFVLEHPTISRFHAVIQFKRSGDAYLYDLGSTHGTFLNKNQVEANTYVDLHVGDVIRFGRSSRLFVFQGPSDLMPPETDFKIMREAKMRERMLDREASLHRAKLEASLADGISWGMGEDAIEEDEDDGDEITWQSYKGQLTEKQEKTREKILKRMEKIANMKKEINAIRAKDISQGGLTQGQQTQIARNEQRMAQIIEELENLEETLNDSIRESLGARAGRKSVGKKNSTMEDEEEYLSDDDEFYDRTIKKPSCQKAGDNQTIETADTLLDKKDDIIKEINEKKELLLIEKNKMPSESTVQDEVGDALDAYMSGLSSQLVHDKSVQLEKELSTLQSELDRISYLLKIADPTGEATKKRELKLQESKPNKPQEAVSVIKKKPPVETKKKSELSAKADGSIQEGKTAEANVSLNNLEAGADQGDSENVVYTVTKPQWLGAVDDRVTGDTEQVAAPLNMDEMDVSNQFIDYKDRNKILATEGDGKTMLESGIESAAPGLILRKRKQVEKTETGDCNASQQETSSSMGELVAEDAVALLLKHKRGLYASDENQDASEANNSVKDKKPKRVLGPQKPSFLSSDTDYESWVPPEGQSGDGRTSLNERYGY